MTPVGVPAAYGNPLDDASDWLSNAGSAVAQFFGVGDARARALSDHTVETVSPSGTTIDLFDYTSLNEINSHSDLYFGSTSVGTGGGNVGKDSAGKDASINAWTGKSYTEEDGRFPWIPSTYIYKGGPYIGVVQNRLVDGYPVLAAGNRYNDTPRDKTSADPLAYLFNHEHVAGKRGYSDVKGLLQLKDGYYIYDSQENYAAFDAHTNEFTVYDTPGVKSSSGVSDRSTGQFFPFTSADSVFTERQGSLVSNEVHTPDYSGTLNYYFGLTMTSNFMQPVDGLNDGKPMTFEFSGDDDVWVFIDDVLVGDVGGLHDAVGLTIDFQKGTVRTYDASSYAADAPNGVITFTDSKFDEIFKDTDVQLNDKGTFKDNTYHTLKFFYLERGAGNSNLKLKYNLVDIPASTMTKVDQLGNPIAGAGFALFASDENYAVPDHNPIATGTTAENGTFTFLDGNGVPLNFKQLNAEGTSYYVLRETTTPSGYRRSPDAHLHFAESKDSAVGFLLSENYWESGVYARAEEVITVAGDTVTGANNEKYTAKDGEVFAVVYKRDKNETDLSRAWHAVSKAKNGEWRVTGNAITDVAQLKDVDRHTFQVDSNGKLSVDLTELPGLPEQYYYMVPEGAGANGDYDYTVGLYYTTATDGNYHRSNTFRLDTDQGFERQTAAHLHVTDIANYVHVQKVDDADNPIDGVRFNLYAAADMERNTEGEIVPRAGAKPVKTGLTEDNTTGADQGLRANGIASLGPVAAGTYYLVEDAKSVAAEYIPNETAIRVIVDDQGVHIDAGVAGDGVFVAAGVGSLIDSMSNFAQKDINASLFDITATLATATATEGSDGLTASMGQWGEANSKKTFNLTFGANDSVLDYGPDGGDQVSFRFDEGFGRAQVTQNGTYHEGAAASSRYGIASYDVLGNRDLTGLFSGTNCAIVVNQREASLEVSKSVVIPQGFTALDTMKDTEFELTFDFTAPNGGQGDSYKAIRFKDVDGNLVQEGDAFEIADLGKVKIKDGETIKVYGLPKDTKYSIEETQDKNNPYSQTKPVDGQGSPSAATGTITDGAVSRVEFENTYTPKSATVAETNFGLTKNFNIMTVGQDGQLALEKKNGAWDKFTQDQRTFMMRLTEVKEGAGSLDCPFPKNAKVKTDENGNDYITTTVTSDTNAAATANFGAITFTKPGTYVYLVSEDMPAKPVAGITYSRSSFRIVVTVTDEDGVLKAAVSKLHTYGDAGAEIPGNEQTVSAIEFNNSAAYDSDTIGPRAIKKLTDTTGKHDLSAREFTFGVKVCTPNAPVPTDAKGQPLPKPDGKDYYIATNNASGEIAFGTATFTKDDDGKTYVYKLFEVIPDDAINPKVDDGNTKYEAASGVQKATAGWTKNGMVYDGKVYYAHVAVTVDANEKDNINYVKTSLTYRESEAADSQIVAADSIVFNNTYDPADVSIDPQGEKTLIGRDAPAGEKFSFTLKPKSDATIAAVKNGSIKLGATGPAESLTASVDKLTDGTAKDFTFDSITFGKPGAYTFTIDEDAGNAGGVTYDSKPVTLHVTVAISDDNPGALTATAYYVKQGSATQQQKAAFANTYTASETFAGIDVTKTLEGRDLKEGEFSFTVSADEGSNNHDAANAKLTEAMRSFANGAPTQDAPATATMKALAGLKFDQADAGKTFSYLIDEVEPADGNTKGVSYDKSQFRVDLTVKDDGDGTMTVTTSVTRVMNATGDGVNPGTTENGIEFHNIYKAGSTTVDDTSTGLPLTKKLEGRSWGDADVYEFKISAQSFNGSSDQSALEAMPMPVEKDGKVQVTKDSPAYRPTGAVGDPEIKQFGFTKLTFSNAGTYTYSVREVIPEDATNPNVNKGNTQYKDAGDKKAEPGWTKNGITYSSVVATITYVVKDDGQGALYVANRKLDPSAAPTFVNTYNAAVSGSETDATNVEFTKEFKGREWAEDETFEFKLEALTEGAPMPEGSTDDKTKLVTVSGTDADDGEATFSFGKIKFTMDMVANEPNRTKRFEYRVTEVVPTTKLPGVSYSSNEALISVDVTDNGNGVLTATTTSQKTTFTNTYDPGSVNLNTRGAIQIVKNMIGRAIAENDFEFTMTAKNKPAISKFGADGLTLATRGAALGVDGKTAVEILTVQGDGLDEKLTFGRADVGEYMFEITEQHAGETIDGVAYDADSHALKLKVSDAGAGVLKVEAFVDNTATAAATWTSAQNNTTATDTPVRLEFTNSYSASMGGDVAGGLVLKGTKIMTGRKLVDGEFGFTVTNAADKSAQPTPVATGSNDADGNIVFSPINYTTEKLNDDVKSGMAKPDASGDAYTYQYKVTEDQGGNHGGVTMDRSEFSVTVKVTDDHKGALSAEVKYPDGGIVFNNQYGAGATATVAVKGVKALDSAEGSNPPTLQDIAGKYTFTLEAVTAGAPMPAGDGAVATNDAAGNISFGQIEYTMDNTFGASGETEKAFTYKVTEAGELPGITNESGEKTITVTVKDNGDGTLSVVQDKSVTTFTFTNMYKPNEAVGSLTGEGGFSVRKELVGRALEAGEFEFALTSAQTGEVVKATNDAQGNVAFPNITFSKVGAYRYSLTEVPGDLGGVTYDDARYDVVAQVEDKGAGALTVTWSVSKDGKPIEGTDIVFSNSYSVAPVTLSLGASKVLAGRVISEGEFSFELLENGKVVSKAKNAAPGKNGVADIVFNGIEYTEPGEHEYTVHEVRGDAEGVTYDESVYTITVNVVDDGKGSLVSEVSYGPEGAPVFHNTYKRPAVPVDPKPEGPKPIDPKPEDSRPSDGLPGTGDGIVAAVVVTAGTGLISMAVGAHLNKRKKHHG